MRVLFLGDVVGRSGRNALIEKLPGLRARYGAHFVVVNGENAAGAVAHVVQRPRHRGEFCVAPDQLHTATDVRRSAAIPAGMGSAWGLPWMDDAARASWRL